MSKPSTNFNKYSLVDLSKLKIHTDILPDSTLFGIDACDPAISLKNSICFFKDRYSFLSPDFEDDNILFWTFQKGHPLYVDISNVSHVKRSFMDKNSDYRPARNSAGLSCNTFNSFRSASLIFLASTVTDLNIAAELVRLGNIKDSKDYYYKMRKERPECFKKLSNQEKYDLMTYITRAKFSDSRLGQRLIRTGSRTILNVNEKEKDKLFGISRQGEMSMNSLGKILMLFRKELQMCRGNVTETSASAPEEFLDIVTSDDAIYFVSDPTWYERTLKEFLENKKRKTIERGENDDDDDEMEL